MFGFGAHLEQTLDAIVGDETLAEDFGDFSGDVAARHVHLPEAVLGGDVALGGEEVVEVDGLDVRDSMLIAADGDLGRKAGYLNGTVDLGQGSADGVLEPECSATDCSCGEQDEDDEDPCEETQPGVLRGLPRQRQLLPRVVEVNAHCLTASGEAAPITLFIFRDGRRSISAARANITLKCSRARSSLSVRNPRSEMKKPTFTDTLLLLIAVSLMAIAIKPYVRPQSARADSGQPYPLYIEPGTQMLRAPDGSKQVYGRVMIDMRTGKVWGFPTKQHRHLSDQRDGFETASVTSVCTGKICL